MGPRPGQRAVAGTALGNGPPHTLALVVIAFLQANPKGVAAQEQSPTVELEGVPAKRRNRGTGRRVQGTAGDNVYPAAATLDQRRAARCQPVKVGPVSGRPQVVRDQRNRDPRHGHRAGSGHPAVPGRRGKFGPASVCRAPSA